MKNQIIEDGYQIIVVNIKYGKDLNKHIKDKPSMVILDVPESILKCKTQTEKFKDNLESFAYNTITKKYGAEVYKCQIWMTN
jgi:hypothetical protein